jgi:hypothetical protein
MEAMQSLQYLENALRSALKPITPRVEYVKALKRRLLLGQRMRVEMEVDRSVQDTLTLATVGLGALATVAAITTLGVQLFQRTNARRARQPVNPEPIAPGRMQAQ